MHTITSTEVVTEKYYIQHADAGLKFETELYDKLSLYGLGSYGYVFYNEADNKTLGKIKGKGGYIADANLGLMYSLTDSLRLMLGGFAEFQHLKGAEKNDVIWPDNDLNIYGGNAGIQYLF